MLDLLDSLGSFSQRDSRSQVERKRDHRELSLMIDGEERTRRLEVSKRRERHLCAVRRMHVDIFERIRGLLKARVHLEDNVILIQLREDGRYLSLTEGVVQSVVDCLWQNTEPRRRVPINDEVCLQTVCQLITGNITQFRQDVQLLHESWHPDVQVVGVGGLQRVLELSAADAILDCQILHG